jgi:hypothetical protein
MPVKMLYPDVESQPVQDRPVVALHPVLELQPQTKPFASTPEGGQVEGKPGSTTVKANCFSTDCEPEVTVKFRGNVSVLTERPLTYSFAGVPTIEVVALLHKKLALSEQLVFPLDKLRPVTGNEAPPISQPYEPVPPDAFKSTEYACPTVAFGRTDGVVILIGGTVG